MTVKTLNACVTEESPAPAAMRRALRPVASTVYVVGLRTSEEEFFATTVTAVTSVSFEPPTLAVCLNRSGAQASALREGALISISALTSEQVDVASACAGAAPHHERDVHFVNSSVSNVPAVRDAQTVFICQCGKILENGTHLVIFADVVGVHRNEDVDPLIYFDGQYGRATAMRGPGNDG